MKYKFNLLIIIIAVMFAFGGCNEPDIQNEENTNTSQISETEMNETEILQESEAVQEGITIFESSETVVELFDKNLEINCEAIIEDNEVYQLAIKKVNELQNLFIDFLNFNEEELVFSYNGIIYGKYLQENGNEDDVPFCIINDDNIKTYDDLYSLFNKNLY